MEPEVIAALIAVAGVVLSAFIAWLTTHLTLRFNYKQLFAETVSKNRMEWINVWRENIAKFISCAKILHTNKTQTEFNLQCEKEMYEARVAVTSRLNLNEEKHKLLLTTMLEFNLQETEGRFNAQCEYIESLARDILKPEWERVKREAKGKEN